MEFEFSYTVTPNIITTATRRFWLQFVGWGGLIRWLLIAVLLIAATIFSHQEIWLNKLAAFVIVFIPLVWVVGYVTFLRRAFYRYGKMESKLISFRFTEETLGTKTDLGNGEISWRMLDKVQRYSDVWLLFFGKRDYIYFPTAEMPAGLGAYILRQAEKHSARVT